LDHVDIEEQINVNNKIKINLKRVILEFDESHLSPQCFKLIDQLSPNGKITQLNVSKKYSSMAEDCKILFSLIFNNPSLDILGSLVRRNQLHSY
jgi:hypothetical protein